MQHPISPSILAGVVRAVPVWRQSSAFTLVELLAVITIIGVLAALILPALGAMRALSRASACASNLRQIGVAMYLYTHDNRGILPPARINAAGWPHGYWVMKLQPYLENRKASTQDDYNQVFFGGVFRCPGKPSELLARLTHQSYGMNTFGTFVGGVFYSNQDVGKELVSLNYPAITALVSDTGEGNPALRSST